MIFVIFNRRSWSGPGREHRHKEVPGTNRGQITSRAGSGAGAGPGAGSWAEASAESVAATNTARERVVRIWGG